VPHRAIGHTDLNYAAGVEQLVGQLDGQRCRHVLAACCVGYQLLAREFHQREGDVRRLPVEPPRQCRQLERLVQGKLAGEHQVTHGLVRCSSRMFSSRPSLPRKYVSGGGSIESEETALAVVPKSTPSTVVVMTVTPLANRPITSRKSCCSTTASSGRSMSSLLVTVLPPSRSFK
jgi:hypothetical protein